LRDSLESLITRGISIASKFLLVGFLAKELSLDDYGSFQLTSYFVLLSTTIFGLEYYNITNRKIPKSTNKPRIYDEHIYFFVLTSPLVIITQIVLFLLIFPKELISFASVVLVLLIGLCDYFSQEVYRYLMINKFFRKGNIQLIYKSLLFVLILIGYAMLIGSLTFNKVLIIMLIAYLMLFGLAANSFNRTLYSLKKVTIAFPTKTEIQGQLKAVTPFIVLIVFLKGIEFSDKFIISKKLGLEETGIYSFLFAVASSIHVFIVSGFYIIYLPRLIKLYAIEKKRFTKTLSVFALLTLASSVILVFIIPLIAPFIFEIIGKEAFSDQKMLLQILLIGFLMNNLSLIPHIYLYIVEDEKFITFIMAFSFLVNVTLNMLLIPKFEIMGSAYSLVVTYLTVFLLKTIRAAFKWNKTTA